MRAPKLSTVLGLSLCLTLGITLGCAGKKKGSESPAVCMQTCESECPYVPDGVGDNDEYLECLEACEAQCGG
jgi:hypothetical protein